MPLPERLRNAQPPQTLLLYTRTSHEGWLARSPLACSSNSCSLFCRALTSCDSLLSLVLLTLCSSNNRISSCSSGVGSTGKALVNLMTSCRISESVRCFMSIVWTRSVGACAEGVVDPVVDWTGAGEDVAESEVWGEDSEGAKWIDMMAASVDSAVRSMVMGTAGL